MHRVINEMTLEIEIIVIIMDMRIYAKTRGTRRGKEQTVFLAFPFSTAVCPFSM